jgi:hypothetical protein
VDFVAHLEIFCCWFLFLLSSRAALLVFSFFGVSNSAQLTFASREAGGQSVKNKPGCFGTFLFIAQVGVSYIEVDKPVR